MNQEKTSSLVKMALLTAIIIVLTVTPLGFIPLGFMWATTIHIPVILGSILLGPKRGAVLGLVFGLSSMIKATVTPIVTNFVFSPFYSVGETHGNFWSIVVSLVPRILVGVVPYYVYKLVKKMNGKENLALSLAGFAGSMTNTLLVMNFIYLFFGRAYAAANNAAFEGFYGAIVAVIFTNGVPEAILATIITCLIVKVLQKVEKYSVA